MRNKKDIKHYIDSIEISIGIHAAEIREKSRELMGIKRSIQYTHRDLIRLKNLIKNLEA